jgi:hypothetical protein
MKKITILLLVVLVIVSIFPSVVYAGGQCEGKKFIPERAPEACRQKQEAQSVGGVGQEDKDERHRVNLLYNPRITDKYPYMPAGW